MSIHASELKSVWTSNPFVLFADEKKEMPIGVLIRQKMFLFICVNHGHAH